MNGDLQLYLQIIAGIGLAITVIYKFYRETFGAKSSPIIDKIDMDKQQFDTLMAQVEKLRFEVQRVMETLMERKMAIDNIYQELKELRKSAEQTLFESRRRTPFEPPER